jgi:uncharacterized protein
MSQDRFDPIANRAKHKLPLDFGDSIFADPSHLVSPTFRAIDEGDRFKVVGLVDGKLYTAVFVWRSGVARYISVRRSNKGEERLYRASR